MMHISPSRLFVLFIGLAGCLANAQPTTPSTQQMIEQLKSASPATNTPAAPRTRSLRNLSVEAAPAPGAPPQGTDAPASAAPAVAAAPSLSLLIQFDFNSARVKPESQQALANLAQALQSRELMASRFAVEGHTDAKGRADYNQQLSQQRAAAVRDFLGQQGVDVARLMAQGKGAAELAKPEDPYAAENRRVRIVNLD